jgi:hypothetical protein
VLCAFIDTLTKEFCFEVSRMSALIISQIQVEDIIIVQVALEVLTDLQLFTCFIVVPPGTENRPGEPK